MVDGDGVLQLTSVSIELLVFVLEEYGIAVCGT